MAVALMLVALFITGYIAVVDWNTRRIPNMYTLPLIAVGVVLHAALWLHDLPLAVIMAVCFFAAWATGFMGGGDAKLWMGLIFWTPPYPLSLRVGILGVVFAVTAFGQMVWRWQHRLPLAGIPAPAAWRAVVYVLVLLAIEFQSCCGQMRLEAML